MDATLGDVLYCLQSQGRAMEWPFYIAAWYARRSFRYRFRPHKVAAQVDGVK